ncbi:MAG: hypothetical protein QNJ73_16885 [Gammaproteobacteria bacterium]|nr:hypothetical protein [Gammaproteobacteria bacterium]
MTQLLLAALGLGLLGIPAVAETEATEDLRYRVNFDATISAGSSDVPVTLTLDQDGQLLEELRLRAPRPRYRDFAGDGTVTRNGDRVIWQPPANGGQLNYTVELPHRRNSSGYDAWVASDWAMFRGEDLFPPAASSFTDGARSVSRLSLNLPADWTAVTAFKRLAGFRWVIDNPNRSFDRPTGWIAAGRLGVRRDRVAGIRLTVAGPRGQGVQRVGMLGLLRWTVPTLAAKLPIDIERIAIVAAGDPMWRGGLSGPASLYVHADRPLLSENGTSTLVHELIHVVAPVPAARDQDWIDEGLAEYLTLLTLRDSGTISDKRFDNAIARFRARGQAVDNMSTPTSAGAITARAVTVFHDLDREIRRRTDGEADIYALVTRLMQEAAPVGLPRLQDLASEMCDGEEIDALAAARLPGAN